MSETPARNNYRTRLAVAAVLALTVLPACVVVALDLAARSRPKPADLPEPAEQVEVVPMNYWVIGPFGPDLQAEYGPERDPDPRRPHPFGGEQLAWRRSGMVHVADGDYCLDFRKTFDREQSSGYALTYVQSPADIGGRLLIGSDDTVKVWLNGEAVHEFTRPRVARVDEDRAAVRWKRGRNTLLIKVANGINDHMFFAKLVGPRGLSAGTELGD